MNMLSWEICHLGYNWVPTVNGNHAVMKDFLNFIKSDGMSWNLKIMFYFNYNFLICW